MKIRQLIGREIFDSRGLPTLACDLILEDGRSVTASVPAGTSRGSGEAIEMRDGGERLMGMGLKKAIDILEQKIAPRFVGHLPELVQMDLQLIEMDGTLTKEKFGANTLLAVSMAVAKAQALINGVELYELVAELCDLGSVSLPLPMFNMINGGAHANSGLQIQEFIVVPVHAPTFRIAMESAAILFHTLGNLLKKKKKSTAVGLEGGFAADFKSEHEALDLLMEGLEQTKNDREGNFVLALDVAATQFYDSKKKRYRFQGEEKTTEQMIAFYEKLADEYPIYSIEDGLSEDDWDGWIAMQKALGSDVQLVGDDIFVTNPQKIAQGIEKNAAGAVLIKPNQIGTITETLQAIKLCKEYDMNVIISHRSGETNDSFIADLAVGTSAGLIKAGGCSRGERLAKYNRLLRIEDMLVLSMLNS